MTIVRDEQGIALGGVRTPLVDVPVARNDGEQNLGSTFCALFGTTAPLDAATLAALYSGGPEEYAAAFKRAAGKAVKSGFLLRPEADNYKAAAKNVSFR